MTPRHFPWTIALLFVLPLAATESLADPGNGNGSPDQAASHSHRDAGNQTGDQGGNGQDIGGANDHNETVDLQASNHGHTSRLEWTLHGNPRHAKKFNVYRSTNAAASRLIAQVDGKTRSFTDNETGQVNSYVIEVLHTDGSTGARSNSRITFGCDWISISPGGNPPVLFHPDCLASS